MSFKYYNFSNFTKQSYRFLFWVSLGLFLYTVSMGSFSVIFLFVTGVSKIILDMMKAPMFISEMRTFEDDYMILDSELIKLERYMAQPNKPLYELIYTEIGQQQTHTLIRNNPIKIEIVTKETNPEYFL